MGGRCEGIISGYVFKIIRESLNLTQRELAEKFEIDTTTVQAWESGRRSLTALKMSDVARLGTRLIRLGAKPALLDVLTEAISADLVLGEAVAAGPRPASSDRHPLAAQVHRRSLSSLITWPLTGVIPPKLDGASGIASGRRGPVSAGPVLTPDERHRFFDHLLVSADANRGPDNILLRRQAVFLLGYDERTETADWLGDEQQRAVTAARRADDVPSWVAVRSSAVALARQGNPEPLHMFVNNALLDDRLDLANLNYWAYWLGEYHELHADDEFMTKWSDEWAGARVLAHLLANLRPDVDQRELYIHTLWALLAARPGLIRYSAHVRDVVRGAVDQVSAADVDSRTRQQLASVAYAIRFAER
jgi:transcriptional regulator with XRE-family HTH domain